ncbi:hypothetical protein BX616_003871 [Lobosporangium transversale]|nr:hypothetical protein BX616_003871 [Lobosporangium transversale]
MLPFGFAHTYSNQENSGAPFQICPKQVKCRIALKQLNSLLSTTQDDMGSYDSQEWTGKKTRMDS